jgi:hypothetical protein
MSTAGATHGPGPARSREFVTVIIDLTPVRDRTGPARLLDMVSGRSKAVFTTWLQAQTPEFRAGIETVAMDGFTGYKSAATEALPDAVTVMDPFYDDLPVMPMWCGRGAVTCADTGAGSA